MNFTLGSIHGSPGATSWMLLFAAAWPTGTVDERVALEADASGGVLGARYGWGVDPGVVSLVSQLRRGDGGAIVIEKAARRVSDDVFVVPGPETGEQAVAVWRNEADAVAECLAADSRVWLVDAGRLEESSPTIGFVDRSAMTLLVCGGRPEELLPVPARVASLRRRCHAVGLLVTGSCAYSPDELADFTGADSVWLAKNTTDLAETAGAVLVEGRARRRSWLWRRALEIAAEVADVAQPGGSTSGTVEPVEVLR